MLNIICSDICWRISVRLREHPSKLWGSPWCSDQVWVGVWIMRWSLCSSVSSWTYSSKLIYSLTLPISPAMIWHVDPVRGNKNWKLRRCEAGASSSAKPEAPASKPKVLALRPELSVTTTHEIPPAMVELPESIAELPNSPEKLRHWSPLLPLNEWHTYIFKE